MAISRCPRSVMGAFALSLLILHQTLRILHTYESVGVQRMATVDVGVDVENLDHLESIFVVVVSMQRSSSTFLSRQVLAGFNHSKEGSPINQAPPMSSCPFRHFITLKEIFTNHPNNSGDAWEVEGAELLSGGKHPKDLTVPQLSDFLRRVAQRRCRSRVQEDLTVFMAKDNVTKLELIADCPEDIRHHQCAVIYKHFDLHLPFEKDDKIWETLIPNVRIFILERSVEDRWRSYWFARQTGDWNTEGIAEHKNKLAELKKKVPPVPHLFRSQHENWYNFVRKALEPGQRLGGVPKMELTFDYVVAQPLEVRAKALHMIWDETAAVKSSRQVHLPKESGKGHFYDPIKIPAGFSTNFTADEASVESKVSLSGVR